MLMFGMPEKGTEALLVLLGTVGTAFNSIIGYYYGNQTTKPNGNGNGNGHSSMSVIPPKPQELKPAEPKPPLTPVNPE
jgi:hypothetical protein